MWWHDSSSSIHVYFLWLIFYYFTQHVCVILWQSFMSVEYTRTPQACWHFPANIHCLRVLFCSFFSCTRSFRDALLAKSFNTIRISALRGPHHFPETAFYRTVILPKRHVVECQLVESLYCRIVKLPKIYNVEWHFIESVFSRTSFSRIVIFSNVFFSNDRLAELHFPESPLSRTSFSRKCLERNKHHY